MQHLDKLSDMSGDIHDRLTLYENQYILRIMSDLELLSLKQQLTKLTDTERKEMSAFLIRLGHENPEWKAETARRLDEMAAGNKTSVQDLRDQLGNG